MKGTEELRKTLADWLTRQGVPAVCAWPERRREPAGEVMAVVSLRRLEGSSPGFQDYLGEQFDPELSRWVELYGKRVRLTFGVELCAASAHQVGLGLDRAAEALGAGRPGGLKLLEFSAGETVYQKESGRYCCPAQAVFEAWAFGRTGEDGSFVDFEVRGAMRV